MPGIAWYDRKSAHRQRVAATLLLCGLGSRKRTYAGASVSSPAQGQRHGQVTVTASVTVTQYCIPETCSEARDNEHQY